MANYRIASRISWIHKLSGTCNNPKIQQISGQSLPVSELVLRSYISGETLCGFRAMWESVMADWEPVNLKRSVTGKYTDHAGFPFVLNTLCSKLETI